MSLLDKIPHIKVKTDIESLDLYRLGVFNASMFELVELQAGQFYPPHIHKKSRAALYFVLGEGKIILDGREHNYRPGAMYNVGKGISHGFKVRTQTLILSIQTPPIIDQRTDKVDIKYKYN